jgi:hypothetical protein
VIQAGQTYSSGEALPKSYGTVVKGVSPFSFRAEAAVKILRCPALYTSRRLTPDQLRNPTRPIVEIQAYDHDVNRAFVSSQCAGKLLYPPTIGQPRSLLKMQPELSLLTIASSAGNI